MFSSLDSVDVILGAGGLLLGLWEAAGDRTLPLATVEWPSLMAFDLRGQVGSYEFSFSAVCRKAEKTHLQKKCGEQKRVKTGAVRSEEQSESSCPDSRWLPVAGSNPR